MPKDAQSIKKQFDSFIIIKGLYGVETRYYKIEDFNEIVDVILQENLLDVTLPFTPAINQRKVKFFAKKNVETQGIILANPIF